MNLQSYPTLSVQTATEISHVGETITFSIVININSGGSFGSGAFTLSYDQTILQLRSFLVGQQFLGWTNTSECGVLRFNAVSTSGANGLLVLGTGQFKALVDGDTALSLGMANTPVDSLGSALTDLNIVSSSIKVGRN
ncbi:MAG: cohesin domain-containing protein [Chloroflexota bacterium]